MVGSEENPIEAVAVDGIGTVYLTGRDPGAPPQTSLTTLVVQRLPAR